MNEKEIHIQKLNLGSFIKFNFLISLSFGIGLGFIGFIVSIFGGNVNTTVNGEVFSGITAGIIGIFISPLIMIFIGFIMSLIVFLPLWATLKITKGIKIKGDFLVIDSSCLEKESEEDPQNIEKESEVHIPWEKK